MRFAIQKQITTNEALYTLIQQKGVSFTDVTEKIGVHKSIMSQILHNKKKPTLEQALKIAKFFNVDSRIIWNCECFE